MRPRLSGSAFTVANTTTETVLAAYAIPASDAVAGACYRIEAWGIASCTGTPTLTLQSRIGGVGGTALVNNIFTFSSGVTLKRWKCTATLVCITTGGSGTWHGNITSVSSIPSAGANNTTGATTLTDGTSSITRDTTIANDFVITADWSAASSSNTLTMDGYIAERIA